MHERQTDRSVRCAQQSHRYLQKAPNRIWTPVTAWPPCTSSAEEDTPCAIHTAAGVMVLACCAGVLTRSFPRCLLAVFFFPYRSPSSANLTLSDEFLLSNSPRSSAATPSAELSNFFKNHNAFSALSSPGYVRLC